MKNTTWLLLFQLFIFDIFCNESILSKFHQNGFKLKNKRIQLMGYDNETYNYFNIKAFKYNRTTTAHNCTANFKIDVKNDLEFTVSFKIDVKNDLEIVVQVYKFLSNEYRHFPIRFQINLKKAYDSNAIGLRDVRKCGNMTFYFDKDVQYYFCNFVIDETQFPPLIPNGQFRIDLTYLYRNKEVAWISIYVEVYTPMKYPSK